MQGINALLLSDVTLADAGHYAKVDEEGGRARGPVCAPLAVHPLSTLHPSMHLLIVLVCCNDVVSSPLVPICMPCTRCMPFSCLPVGVLILELSS